MSDFRTSLCDVAKRVFRANVIGGTYICRNESRQKVPGWLHWLGSNFCLAYLIIYKVPDDVDGCVPSRTDDTRGSVTLLLPNTCVGSPRSVAPSIRCGTIQVYTKIMGLSLTLKTHYKLGIFEKQVDTSGTETLGT